jgi:uncharacterized protein YidB (DUF937 family)
MGLLDSLKQEAMAAVNKFAGDHPQLGSEIANLVHTGPGGLSALVQQFQANGLGSIIQSWVSTGPNQPITAQQIQQALGSEKVKQIAARIGLDPNVVTQKLSAVLPQIVNHLTPNGVLPGTPPPHAPQAPQAPAR